MNAFAGLARSSRVHWNESDSVAQALITRSVLAALQRHVPAEADFVAAAFDDQGAADTFVTQMAGQGSPTTTLLAAAPPLVAVVLCENSTLAQTVAVLAGAKALFDIRGAVHRHGATTKIQWTEHTWNPWVGCTRVSDGCTNCYAEREAPRLARMGKKPYAAVVRKIGGKDRWNNRVELNSKKQQYWPDRVRRPSVFFTASMTDIFHEKVPREWLVELHAVIRRNSHHRFQILTKRPDRAAAFYASRPDLAALSNIWLGTSVEDARVLHRVDILRTIPVERRWISAEPLIGPLNGLDLTGIGWVITGARVDGRAARSGAAIRTGFARSATSASPPGCRSSTSSGGTTRRTRSYASTG